MIRFKKESRSLGTEFVESESVITIHGDDATWPEVADAFYRFLLASGYILTREDLAAYYDEDSKDDE